MLRQLRFIPELGRAGSCSCEPPAVAASAVQTHSPVSTAAPRHWPRPARLAAHARCHLHRDKRRTVRAAAAGWVQQECRLQHCNSNSGATASWAALRLTPRLLCLTTDPGILLYFCGQEGGVGGDSILLLLLLQRQQDEQKQSSANFDRVSHCSAHGCSCARPSNNHTCARRRCAAPATPEDAAGECPTLTGWQIRVSPLGRPWDTHSFFN